MMQSVFLRARRPEHKQQRRDAILTAARNLAREFGVRNAGIGGLLYRAANPPPLLAQLYLDDPELAATHHKLLPTLVRTLSALAAGLPTLRDKSPQLTFEERQMGHNDTDDKAVTAANRNGGVR